jgi:hypothetical protein
MGAQTVLFSEPMDMVRRSAVKCRREPPRLPSARECNRRHTINAADSVRRGGGDSGSRAHREDFQPGCKRRLEDQPDSGLLHCHVVVPRGLRVHVC